MSRGHEGNRHRAVLSVEPFGGLCFALAGGHAMHRMRTTMDLSVTPYWNRFVNTTVQLALLSTDHGLVLFRLYIDQSELPG